MKNDGTCYFVGWYNVPSDIDSPKCKSVKQAESLAEHYQIDELNCYGHCAVYEVRNAQRRNVMEVR